MHYHQRAEPLALNGLLEWIQELEGPRLLIVNTVQSAAVIAQAIANKYGRDKVEHISTSLTPNDRASTLSSVKTRLDNSRLQQNKRKSSDWTLVATSCVEAGVDLSFRTGLRENASLVSLIQLGGRVNRHQEASQADVWAFTLQPMDFLRLHPGFKDSAKVLELLFSENSVSPNDCKEALRREICLSGLKDKIRDREIAMDFPEVHSLFRVINADTYTVVVDEEIKQRLKKWDSIPWKEIQNNSVQIWGYRLESLNIPQFPSYPDLYEWNLV